MKKLIRLFDRFLEHCDWKTISVLKVCVCMFGVLLGLTVPNKYKKPIAATAVTVFLMTYVPLMAKLFTILVEEEKPSSQDFTI